MVLEHYIAASFLESVSHVEVKRAIMEKTRPRDKNGQRLKFITVLSCCKLSSSSVSDFWWQYTRLPIPFIPLTKVFFIFNLFNNVGKGFNQITRELRQLNIMSISNESYKIFRKNLSHNIYTFFLFQINIKIKLLMPQNASK